MLKLPFFVGFGCGLGYFLLAACNSTNNQQPLNTEIFQEQKEEIFQIKEHKSCNSIQAIADIMFGEGENQPLYAKYDLGYFLISEAKKENRTLCEELKHRKPGGALKYSSMHANLKNLKNKRAKSYAKILEEAEDFWNNHKQNYPSMEQYNHYITLKKAKNSPPEWFKYYIVKYKISGDHVFVDLDFKDKHKVKSSGKYLKNYQKLLKDIEKKKI